MSIPGSGYEFEPQEVSWKKRDILLFASSIGCKADELHFLYELHPNFAVFPTYPVILPLKLTDQDVTDFSSRQNLTHIPGGPKLDFRNRLDGQRQITILKPLPQTSTGRRFYLRNKVIGVYDKGDSGTAIETEQYIVEEETGAVYSKTTSSSFLVGQGNWGGPRGPRTFLYKPPEGMEPTSVCIVKTSEEAAYLYRLNGDYNPLHASPERGRQQGFPGTIIHGLFSWNSAAHSILRELGSSDPANLKEFQARFASPVYPGDTLITEIWRTGQKQDDFEDIRFTTKNDKVRITFVVEFSSWSEQIVQIIYHHQKLGVGSEWCHGIDEQLSRQYVYQLASCKGQIGRKLTSIRPATGSQEVVRYSDLTISSYRRDGNDSQGPV